MDPKASFSGEKIVQFEGELTVDRAMEIREKLLEAVQRFDDIRVILGEITTLDLSFLQILCSAHRTCKDLNKSFKIKGNCPKVFKDAILESGLFRRKSGCGRMSPDCIWLEEYPDG